MEFNQSEEKIIEIISLTGVSRLKELKTNEGLKEFSVTQITTKLKHLEEVGALNREIIRLGGSGKFNFYTFELSELGKEIAEKLTGKKPTKNQKEVLLERHNNLEIGYLFEDYKPLLKEKEILLDKTENLYSLTMNGKTYPILLDAKTKGEKIYKKEEYLQMLDLMWKQSSVMFYLSTSHTQSNFLILDEIEEWIKTRNLSKEEMKSFQFYTSFMGSIFEGNGEKWSSVYDLWENGMLNFGKKPSIL